MSEKPRCSTCKHYVSTSGRCEAGLPEVSVIAGKPNDIGFADRSVTAWREVKEDDGCGQHTDFAAWLKNAVIVTTKPFDQFNDEDINNIRGPYVCKCVMLNKANGFNRITIVHRNRNLSASTTCEICGGSGIPNENYRPSEPVYDPMTGNYVEEDGARILPQTV